MDSNQCPDGFDDLPLGSPSRMDYTLDCLTQELDEEITTIQQPPINFGTTNGPYSGMIFESRLGSTVSLPPPSVATTSDNPLLEIVEAAKSSSLGLTRRATSSRTYKNFSREDVVELILAVEKSGKRTSWKSIAEIPRFKEKGRTVLQLLEKWRDITKHADINRKDPEMKDLYSWAKRVKMDKKKRN